MPASLFLSSRESQSEQLSSAADTGVILNVERIFCTVAISTLAASLREMKAAACRRPVLSSDPRYARPVSSADIEGEIRRHQQTKDRKRTQALSAENERNAAFERAEALAPELSRFRDAMAKASNPGAIPVYSDRVLGRTAANIGHLEKKRGWLLASLCRDRFTSEYAVLLSLEGELWTCRDTDILEKPMPLIRGSRNRFHHPQRNVYYLRKRTSLAELVADAWSEGSFVGDCWGHAVDGGEGDTRELDRTVARRLAELVVEHDVAW